MQFLHATCSSNTFPCIWSTMLNNDEKVIELFDLVTLIYCQAVKNKYESTWQPQNLIQYGERLVEVRTRSREERLGREKRNKTNLAF